MSPELPLPSLSSPSLSGIDAASVLDSEQSSSKCSRVSGPVALLGIKEEMASFNTTFRMATERRMHQPSSATAMEASSSSDAQVAMQELARATLQQKDAYLDDDSMVTIYDSFEDMNQVRAYLGLKRDSLRRCWVERQLEKTNRKISDQPAAALSPIPDAMVEDSEFFVQ